MHYRPLLQALREVGPVVVYVCVNAPAWQQYRGGVITAAACACGDTPTNHAVLLVGYSAAPRGPGYAGSYWLIKNSWGPKYADVMPACLPRPS